MDGVPVGVGGGGAHSQCSNCVWGMSPFRYPSPPALSLGTRTATANSSHQMIVADRHLPRFWGLFAEPAPKWCSAATSARVWGLCAQSPPKGTAQARLAPIPPLMCSPPRRPKKTSGNCVQWDRHPTLTHPPTHTHNCTGPPPPSHSPQAPLYKAHYKCVTLEVLTGRCTPPLMTRPPPLAGGRGCHKSGVSVPLLGVRPGLSFQKWNVSIACPKPLGESILVGDSGTFVSVLTRADSAPRPPSHTDASNASHKVFPRTVKLGGCSPHLMCGMWRVQIVGEEAGSQRNRAWQVPQPRGIGPPGATSWCPYLLLVFCAALTNAIKPATQVVRYVAMPNPQCPLGPPTPTPRH